VLRWLAAGKSNPEIAILISRSVSTIRNQVHSILGKLNASSRAEALVKAFELRLL
jgi:DNA-binding NarL/FixJ family response regulator